MTFIMTLGLNLFFVAYSKVVCIELLQLFESSQTRVIYCITQSCIHGNQGASHASIYHSFSLLGAHASPQEGNVFKTGK